MRHLGKIGDRLTFGPVPLTKKIPSSRRVDTRSIVSQRLARNAGSHAHGAGCDRTICVSVTILVTGGSLEGLPAQKPGKR
jgi:hypothetical protein